MHNSSVCQLDNGENSRTYLYNGGMFTRFIVNHNSATTKVMSISYKSLKLKILKAREVQNSNPSCRLGYVAKFDLLTNPIPYITCKMYKQVQS